MKRVVVVAAAAPRWPSVRWQHGGRTKLHGSVQTAHTLIPAIGTGSIQQLRTFFFSKVSNKRGPLFNIEGLNSAQDFPRLADMAIKEAKEELSAAPRLRPAALVHAVDNASNALCRIADAAELCRNVHPDENFVECANRAVNAVATFMGEANLDVELYNCMLCAERSDAFADLTIEEQKTLRHMRMAMEGEGIHLAVEEKARLLQLMEREQQLSFAIVQQQEFVCRAAISEDNGVWLPSMQLREAFGADLARLPCRGAGEKQDADTRKRLPSGGVAASHQYVDFACAEEDSLQRDAAISLPVGPIFRPRN